MVTIESEPVTRPMRNPPHPGRALRGDLETLGLSVAEAAQALAVSRSQLHRVLSGESAISAELALKLEIVIGGTADAWLRLQAAYDTAKARQRVGEITKGLKRITPPTADRPVPTSPK